MTRLSRVMMLVVVVILGAITIPSHASAATNHYLKLAPVVCGDTTALWSNANCWSLTSGGTPGGGVPASSDDIIIDDNSGTGNGGNLFYYDGVQTIRNILFTVTGLKVAEIEPFDPDSRLTFRTATFTGTGAAIIGADSGVQSVSYTEELVGSAANVASSCADPGLCLTGLVGYTGTNDFGTASYTTFEGAEAVGKTIYCDPGCVDAGGNTNIVFGPAPGGSSTPPDLSDAVRALTASLARILGLMVVLVTVAVLFTFIMDKTNSTIRDGFGRLGGRKGG